METGPKWYILRGGHRIGPIDASQLKYMATTEQLDRSDLVWKEGLPQWVQAQQVTGLFEASVAPAANPTPAEPAEPVSLVVQTPIPYTRLSSEPAPVVTTAAPAQPQPAPVIAPAPRPVQPQPAQPARPRPALPPVSTRRDGWVPVLAGILILLTIFIPWFVGQDYPFGPRKVVWSWDLVDNTYKSLFGSQWQSSSWRTSSPLQAVDIASDFLRATEGKRVLGWFLLVAWSAGLLTILATPITKGVLRATIYTGVGVVAGIFLIIVMFEVGWATGRIRSRAWEWEAVLRIIAGACVVITAITIYLSRRNVRSVAIRVVQIVASALLVAMVLALLSLAFAAKNSLWSQYGSVLYSPYGALLRLTLLVSHVGVIIAALLAFFDGLVERKTKVLSTAALVLLYLVLVLSAVAEALFTAGAFDKWWGLFQASCMLSLILGIALILGSGIVLLVDHMRRRGAPVSATPTGAAARPAAQAAPGESLDQKFAKLEQLRKNNLISEQEYQQKRQQLLGEI